MQTDSDSKSKEKKKAEESQGLVDSWVDKAEQIGADGVNGEALADAFWREYTKGVESYEKIVDGLPEMSWNGRMLMKVRGLWGEKKTAKEIVDEMKGYEGGDKEGEAGGNLSMEEIAKSLEMEDKEEEGDIGGKRLQDYLADAVLESVGLDAGLDPHDPDFWIKHDKAHHGGHFDPETQRCKLREEAKAAEERRQEMDEMDDMDIDEVPGAEEEEESEEDKYEEGVEEEREREDGIDDLEAEAEGAPGEESEIEEEVETVSIDEPTSEGSDDEGLKAFAKTAKSFLAGTDVECRLTEDFDEGSGGVDIGDLRLSVKDIAALSYKMNEQDVSLKTFAETFQQYIKQKDRTIDDVNRIAEEYLKAVKANPEMFMAQVDPAKMSHLRYLFTKDGELYDPNNIRHVGMENDIPRQMYNLYKDALGEEKFGRLVELLKKGKEATKEEKSEVAALESEANASDTMQRALVDSAQKINAERNQKIQDLIQYFSNNDDYTEAEKALIINGAMRYGVSERMGPEGLEVRLVSIADNNEAQIPVVGGELTAKIVERLRNGEPYKKAIVGAVYDMRSISASKRGVPPGFTGWKVHKKDNSHDAAVELNQAVSGTGWCTGGAVSTAQMHRSGGDFHVYFEGGEPKIAIRTQDGRMAEAPRGAHEGQFCTAEEEEIAEKYIREGNGIVAGKEYLDDMADIKRVQSGTMTWQDAWRFPSQRRYENGEYGGDTRAWPEPIMDEVRRIRESHEEERKKAKWYTSDEVAENPTLRDSITTLIANESGRPSDIMGDYPQLKEIVGGAANIYADASVPALESISGVANIYEGASCPALKSIGGAAEISEGASCPA